jgi:hypothetical protein
MSQNSFPLLILSKHNNMSMSNFTIYNKIAVFPGKIGTNIQYGQWLSNLPQNERFQFFKRTLSPNL